MDMTMKFLPDDGICEEAQKSKKKFDVTGRVEKLQTKISKNPCFGNAISRRANFTEFCRILNIDVGYESWKVQTDILKIGYVTEQYVKWRKKLVCKIQNGL